MISIEHLDIKDKTVLIRVDYNVPIVNGVIRDSFRINSSFQTINYCLKNNCKIVLMSHLGRPQSADLSLSLYPVFEYLNEIYSGKIFFAKDCISDEAIHSSRNLKTGQILLLENLRFYKEELECDNNFSSKLAMHGDVFINDAFGTSHRTHASNVGVCKFFKHRGYGFLIQKEKKYLDDILNFTDNRLTLILGGSKISDKIKILNRFIGVADNILIGGAMSNNFLKARGFNIGKSLYEDKYVDYAKEILNNKGDTDVILPIDYVCTQDLEKKENVRNSKFSNIKDNEYAVDIGYETINLFNMIINEKTDIIIWNGPMGIIEIDDFSNGTKEIINSIKFMNENKMISIIGGGDTSSMINKNEYSKFTHISTGGGASLKLLSGEIMDSFEALKNE
tara:strand:+ start:1157 stop:2335 length:1179 start_codon:yes stop_codon:yes gene_type:complete